MIGDPVNVAARLEQTAGEMEILIGELTYRLVRDAVEVEPVEPLELKGKSERVPAYRLVSVRPERQHGEFTFPLIGRESELSLLQRELGRARTDRSCRLVTLLADPGVGKTRLVAEFARSVEGEADVLRGRCLAYGRGITFWPLAEAVRQAAGIVDDDAATALEKLAGIVGNDTAVLERLSAAFGLSDAALPCRRALLGGADAARVARAPAPARRRVRGHPLGGDDVPRPDRAPG